jgi:hypothetical protein
MWKVSYAAGMTTMWGMCGGDIVLELFCRHGVVPSNDDVELLRYVWHC